MTTVNAPRNGHIPIGAVTFAPEKKGRPQTWSDSYGGLPIPDIHKDIANAIKDSGKRETFDTGAVRDVREGKGRFDLLPFEGMERVAQTFEDGCQKYGENNWALGMPVARFMDSALRHAYKYLAGHSDEDHLAMAAWNLICALTTEVRAERGNLPKSLLLESRQKYIGHPEAG